ncbi:TetR family transcriptional regulator C-terminal domain-containing protein [Halomonas saccharevitans]|uniref:TetR family transcriptional regulator C-terminal domain-containing protein n=1 Tax=Halomonas saccharevitans TaxID=416872 RepID=A0ABU3NEL7_9GAMM|nr:TetR family transcriptional regulator C-terminal domain-containing protein [Halomonas saccharevitans]MDT8879633.1 TetR family transcriptional regulator C-terminal domain-containing protein [Halomonas saccharevitans]
MKTQATRDKLIQIGAELIAEQGFNATGINAVLSRAGVPKGSFYHYFSSKEDFGLAVIDAFAEQYDARLVAILQAPDQPPLARLRRYFEAGRTDMHSCDHARGCLIGNLGQELSSRSEAFRARLDQVFRQWERHLVACLEEARAAGEVAEELDVERLAGFILAGWQGAMLRAKTTKSLAPMEAFEQVLFHELLGREVKPRETAAGAAPETP